MRGKIDNIETGLWHQVIEGLKASGFQELSRYGGVAGGVDYNRVDLADSAGEVLLTFEWDNWGEGEVTGDAQLLETIRARYDLPSLLAT